MNLLRRLAALPLALVLLWTMVVAPWAIARCEHACGETRLHALGAACSGDAHDGDRDCPDNSNPGTKKTQAGSAACQLFQSDDAAPRDSSPTMKTPPPADFIPVYPVSLVTSAARTTPAPALRANAPPETPPKQTHGRGALPLLI